MNDQIISVVYKQRNGVSGFAVTLTMPMGNDDSLTTLVTWESGGALFSETMLRANQKAFELFSNLRLHNRERVTKLWTEHLATKDEAVNLYGADSVTATVPPGVATLLGAI